MIALVCTMLSVQATHRALIVGIGDYPEENGWGKINGDKDIPIVEEMLVSNGFSKENIVELRNEQATFIAICKAFEDMIAQSQTGDVVYVHLSCHGQQISDLNGDESDSRDEAFIPYDAKLMFEEGVYEGERHLVDDQLNEYLHRLRQRVGAEGKIIVVADACHSGGGTRETMEEEDEEVVIRGTDAVFAIDNVKRTLKRWMSVFNANPTLNAGKSSITPHAPIPVEWVYISACKDYQCNSEYKGAGSLTMALYQEREGLTNVPLDSLFERLQGFYRRNIIHPQTPTIEKPQNYETKMLL